MASEEYPALVPSQPTWTSQMEKVNMEMSETMGEAQDPRGVAPWVLRERLDHFLQLGCCRAYGEFGPDPNERHVKDFKDMSQLVIKARKSTVHFEDLEALERMVKRCELAIKEWPELEVKYPGTNEDPLESTGIFKQLLPECFR